MSQRSLPRAARVYEASAERVAAVTVAVTAPDAAADAIYAEFIFAMPLRR